MKYCSTRGSVRGLSFREALFSGYASDGGLFVPEEIPKIPLDTINSWLKSKPSYATLVFNVVRLFVSKEEIPDDALKKCIEKAYKNFDIPEVLGLKKCKDRDGKAFTVAELYHGLTASFKDHAMSLVGQIMAYYLQKEEDNVIILVGTSGDTGSAAIKAVEGLKGLDIIVLYPDGKISPVQELQMNSSKANNVHVFAVEGSSDDTDVPIKNVFPGKGLCSINSINWARVMIQIAHFVYLYVLEGEAIDIFLPTGGGGNLAAALLASIMGIKLRLFVSTNENDNVFTFLSQGKLRMGGDVIETPANAMDIRYPYNLERVLYFLSNSPEVTASYMKMAENNLGSFVQIENTLLEKIKAVIVACRVCKNEEIIETIKWCWDLNNYMICPHTATAVFAYDAINSTEKQRPSFIISTASPHKFPEVVSSVGIPLEAWKGEALLNKLTNKLKGGFQTKPNRSMKRGADWLEILREKISEIQSIQNK